jgi:transcription antitermination factor NusG
MSSSRCFPGHSFFDSQQATAIFQPHWYVAYTYPRHEKRVADHIHRAGVECYLPLYTAVHQWNKRRAKVELPLFPGYVFVRIALANRLRVLTAPGVAYLVGTKGEPTPLADAEIEPLRDCLGRKLNCEPVDYLNAGNRVRVIAGPLCGLQGVIVRRSGGTRFIVSIDLIMRSMAINVDGVDLQLLEPAMAMAV